MRISLVNCFGVRRRSIWAFILHFWCSKPNICVIVLDPVMGDCGKLYVSEEVVPVYKSMVRHADLITPNQFETE